MNAPYPPSVSHDECVVQELREHPEYAVEYLKLAFEEAEESADGQYFLLKALRHIAEAHGIAAIAKKAGIPRESLYRVFSSKGNPRLTTLLSLLKAMGLQITVEPLHTST